MSTKPDTTAWGELIRIAREARGLSVRAASKLANEHAGRQVVSAENWGHVERGYQQDRAVTGTPATVAHMAWVVGVSPDRLRSAGNPQAAAILQEVLLQDGEQAGATTSEHEDPTLAHLSRTPGLPDEVVKGLMVLAEQYQKASRTGSGSSS